VKLRRNEDEQFRELPATFDRAFERSVGLADMAWAIRKKRPARASGEQGMAVLDLMLGFLDSSAQGKHYAPVVKYERPRGLVAGGEFD
jgi:hypothetical protein